MSPLLLDNSDKRHVEYLEPGEKIGRIYLERNKFI